MSRWIGVRDLALRQHEPAATRFLLLLLAVDFGFLLLDGVATFTSWLPDDMLSLTRDQGYPEAFQYIKFFWLVGMTAALAARRREAGYLSFAALYGYLGLDDSLQFHERLGGRLAERLDLAPGFGLRAQDFGELAVSAIAGLVLLSVVAISFARGSASFRRASRGFVGLLLLLVFFGVFLDMILMATDLGPTVNRVLAALEDGGEMMAVSLTAWYAFLLLTRSDGGSPGSQDVVTGLAAT